MSARPWWPMELARTTLAGFSWHVPFHMFVDTLVDAIKDCHGAGNLEDDLTPFTLRRSRRKRRQSGYMHALNPPAIFNPSGNSSTHDIR